MSKKKKEITSFSVSAEEKALFREAFGTIKRSHFKEKSEILEEVFFPLSDNYTETLSSDDSVNYFAEGAGLEPKVLRQIQQGEYPIDLKIDLHGDTIESAREKLSLILQKAYDDQYRCLLIIHGKGRNALLKNHVIHWLKQIPFLLYFCSTQPKDGGTGALYVFLKRLSRSERQSNLLKTTLKETRSRIDLLDQKITALLCERLACARQAAGLKKTTVKDTAREEEVLANVCRQVRKAGYPDKYVQNIFQTILEQMRQYQVDQNT